MNTRGPAHGSPARGDRAPAGPAQLGWALLVIAAALVGGLAAAALVHTSLTVAVIVSLIAGGITVLVVMRSSGRPPQLTGDQAREAGDRRPAGTRDVGYGRSATARRQPLTDKPAPLVSAEPESPAFPGSAARRAAPAVPDDPEAATVPVPPASPHAPADPGGTARGGAPVPAEAVVQLLPLPPQPGTTPPNAPWWDSAQSSPPPPGPGARRAPAPDLSTYLAATLIAQCPRCGAFRLDIRQAADGWDFHCQSCDHAWTWRPGTPWPPVRVLPGRRKEPGSAT